MAETERDPGSPRSTRRPMDAVALAQIGRRLHRAAQPPWLHGELARRMGQRLPIIRLQPQHIIDWGAFLGASGDVLSRAYPQARVLHVEPGFAGPDGLRRDRPAAASAAWWPPRRWLGGSWPVRPPVLAEDEVAAAAAQLLWANMALTGAIDPQAVMAQWHRALAVDGFLMFSTLGPGSMPSLRALYAQQGWPPPFAPFVDMHDLGDMLIQAGFADPVMDQEQVTLTWASGGALLDELRQMGGNAAAARLPGLRTPRWRSRLAALLQAAADDAGRVALTFEVVYGHAFRPPPRPRVAAHTEVPLDDLRAMVRAGRRPA